MRKAALSVCTQYLALFPPCYPGRCMFEGPLWLCGCVCVRARAHSLALYCQCYIYIHMCVCVFPCWLFSFLITHTQHLFFLFFFLSFFFFSFLNHYLLTNHCKEHFSVWMCTDLRHLLTAYCKELFSVWVQISAICWLPIAKSYSLSECRSLQSVDCPLQRAVLCLSTDLCNLLTAHCKELFSVCRSPMWWYRARKTSPHAMPCCCGHGEQQRATLASKSKTSRPRGVTAKHSSPSFTETGKAWLHVFSF